jgi:hypothetical protein
VVSKEKGTLVNVLVEGVLDLKEIIWTTKNFRNRLSIQEINLLIEEMMLRTTVGKEEGKRLEVIMQILNREIKVLKWKEILKVETEEALMVKEDTIIKRGEMRMIKQSMERIQKFQS